MLGKAVGLVLLILAAGCASAPRPDGDPHTYDGAALKGVAAGLVTTYEGTPWYRTPGTEPNLAQARMLRDRLTGLGFDADLQHFNATMPLTGATWCRNVVAEREGTTKTDRLVLAAHFDSRAVADKDPDPSRRGEPVLGANDGASGVAILLALADELPPLRHTLRIYLFDCEDQGDNTGGWAVGSDHAAKAATTAELQSMQAFILLDLVGDAELRIPREGRSNAAAPWLADIAFGLAERLGLDRFVNTTGMSVVDDHVAFLAQGVPALDLIHLDTSADGDPFPASHHTTFDDVDHLSEDAMAEVATLTDALIRLLDQKFI